MKPLQQLKVILFLITACNSYATAQAEVQNPVFPFWKIKGNSGINSTTDFIGTTNAADLVLKANNIEGLRIATSGSLLAAGSAGTTPASGPGTRLMWIPVKSAFRAGYASGTQWDDANIGIYSTGVGSSTKATGSYSFASGQETVATGVASTAVCGYDTASGNYSFAAGIRGNASGFVSTVLGDNCKASGIYAVAMGVSTRATNLSSLATGFATEAGGEYTTAMGYYSSAGGSYATALGANTFAEAGYETTIGRWNTDYTPASTTAWIATDRLFTIGNGTGLGVSRSDAMVVLKNGNTGIGISLPTERLEVNGKTKTTTFQMTNGATNGYLLRSDATGNGTWVSIASLGVGSVTLDGAYDYGGAGSGRTITADAGAVAVNGVDGFVATGTVGSGTIPATFAGTRMMWYPRKAAFRAGHTAGVFWDDSSIGLYSAAFGNSTTASGGFSFAAGWLTSASSSQSTAFGLLSIASGSVSFVAGSHTVAGGNYSAAFGENDTASGISSFVAGANNTASGNHSTVTGLESIASGGASVAFGYRDTASGSGSFAAGTYAKASGYRSTAIGSLCTAEGWNSMAFGENTTAKSAYETVVGRWNTNYTPASTTAWSNADRLFTIGNGTATGSRSDALVVLKNGNVGIGVSAPSATLDVVGTVEMFGDWISRTEGTNYLAATDGFVMAWATSSTFAIYTDASATPTTKRLEAQGSTSNAARPNLTCPIKKGHYYRVETISGGNPTIWWLPLGQ